MMNVFLVFGQPPSTHKYVVFCLVPQVECLRFTVLNAVCAESDSIRLQVFVSTQRKLDFKRRGLWP